MIYNVNKQTCSHLECSHGFLFRRSSFYPLNMKFLTVKLNTSYEMFLFVMILKREGLIFLYLYWVLVYCNAQQLRLGPLQLVCSPAVVEYITYILHWDLQSTLPYSALPPILHTVSTHNNKLEKMLSHVWAGVSSVSVGSFDNLITTTATLVRLITNIRRNCFYCLPTINILKGR